MEAATIGSVQTKQDQAKRLSFDEIVPGMKVRYEDMISSQSYGTCESTGTGTVIQKTPHLIAIDNGKYVVSATRISIRLGWFRVTAG